MLFPDEKSRDLAKDLLQEDFVIQTGEKKCASCLSQTEDKWY